MDSPISISVIIPTRNESENLPSSLARVRDIQEVEEIILVDASAERDATRHVAERFGAVLKTCRPGRGTQIAAGTRHAKGDILWILHADTWPHPESGRAILRFLNPKKNVAGGFTKRFRESTRINIGSEFRCHFLFRTAGILFGDQGIFFRREVLDQIGGFPEVPLMEEFELLRKIRKQKLGDIGLIPLPLLTSCRRFTQRGTIRVYITMARILALYYLGVSPIRLAKLYR